VGETFGFLLAHRIASEWETGFARGRPFVVVEQGGHDGQLARDILAGLRELGSPLLETLEYRLVEPREELRKSLESHFSANPDPAIRVVSSLREASAPIGIFLCNELLDAFPVDLLLFEDGLWHERQVGWNAAAHHPEFVTRPLRPEWTDFVAALGAGFPEGYGTEICPMLDEWVAEVAALFTRGLWWIIDYGYERADYYLPRRSSGTLRGYRGHRSTEDPFAHPGKQDLTCHVDFTRVEEAAVRTGLSRRAFTDQHHFLMEAARPWLLSLEGRTPEASTAKRLRQFQTLTHPSLMGQQFKVMELTRNGS